MAEIKDSGERREYKHYIPGYIKGDITLLERMPGGQKWKYKCNCGYVGITQVSENPGFCPICSYKRAAENKRIHGESPDSSKNASRLYRIWLNMKQRCSNPKVDFYHCYGGRGIQVCEEWKKDYLVFKEWSMKNGYSDELSIDRIDPNGNYCPENCRWATWEEQCYNKRTTRRYDLNGESYTIKELSDMSGISYNNLKTRLNKFGWTVEEAITIPAVCGNNQKTRRKNNE